MRDLPSENSESGKREERKRSFGGCRKLLGLAKNICVGTFEIPQIDRPKTTIQFQKSTPHLPFKNFEKKAGLQQRSESKALSKTILRSRQFFNNDEV